MDTLFGRPSASVRERPQSHGIWCRAPEPGSTAVLPVPKGGVGSVERKAVEGALVILTDEGALRRARRGEHVVHVIERKGRPVARFFVHGAVIHAFDLNDGWLGCLSPEERARHSLRLPPALANDDDRRFADA